MPHIDRRRALTSLVAGAALMAAPEAIAQGAFAAREPGALREHAERHYFWLLAHQGGRTRTEHAIEFWTGPWASFHYENYLPRQMSRAFIAYDFCSHAITTPIKALEAFIDASKLYRRDWLDLGTLDRFTVEPAAGSKDFQSILTSIVGDQPPSTRSALLAIDSSFMGLGVPGVRSAFASCCGSIVGITHLQERGFVQEKRYSRTSSESDFVRQFLNCTSLCDTVIVTSSGLLETDAGLCPRASTEDLVGELVRRLSYALLEPNIRDRIVGSGRSEKPKPRYFALGSATLNAPYYAIDLHKVLDRQSAFVSASFAPLATEHLPLFIDTSPEYYLPLSIDWREELAVAAWGSGYPIICYPYQDILATAQAPYYQADKRGPGALDLIALWPFKVDC